MSGDRRARPARGGCRTRCDLPGMGGMVPPLAAGCKRVAARLHAMTRAGLARGSDAPVSPVAGSVGRERRRPAPRFEGRSPAGPCAAGALPDPRRAAVPSRRAGPGSPEPSPSIARPGRPKARGRRDRDPGPGWTPRTARPRRSPPGRSGPMPVLGVVVSDDRAGAVLTARHMAAKHRRAAALDRTHHLQLVEADVPGVGLAPCRPMVAEDIRDLQRRTGHGPGLLGRQHWRNGVTASLLMGSACLGRG